METNKVVRLPPSDLASPTFRGFTRAGSMSRRGIRLTPVSIAAACALLLAGALPAQKPDDSPLKIRARQFLAGRVRHPSAEASRPLGITPQALPVAPRASSLTAPWQPIGPVAVLSASYGKVSGRVTSAAIDTNDATGNTLYAGTTGGGVWKSTNAAGALSAVTFTPLTDTLPVFAANAGGVALPSLSIGAVAVQPASNPVLLAGTGDPNDATDSYYGEGILRSTDGGLTWTLAQGSKDGANGNHSFVGLSVAALAWSTSTPSLVVAALSSAVEGDLVGAADVSAVRGLFYSTDAGLTWKMASIYDGARIVQEPQPVGTGQTGNAATSVVWNALRQRFYAAVRQHGFYESADGITWARLASQPGTGLTTSACPVGVNGAGAAGCPLFRGTLAVQAATGDLYALSVDSANRDNGLWQDLCAGTGTSCAATTVSFAHRIDAGAMEAGSGSTVIAQGDYNLSLAAVSTGTATGTVLYAGSIDLYRCSIAPGTSACTLRNTTNALNGCNAPAMVAPAQHAIAAIAGTATPIVFLGNDGGLWRSLDGVAETGAACSASDALHFDDLNGAIGSLAEITGFAQHPTDAATFLVGLGANGSAATTAAATVWPQLSSGEGGYPAIDPAQPANWYVATGAGVSLKQCTLGSACKASDFTGAPGIGATQVANDAALLDAPTLLDPALTSNVLVGTCRVWRGPASGAGWTSANAISKAFGGGSLPCTASSALLRSLAGGGPVASSTNAQNAGSTVLYAGMAGAADGGGASVGGHVFVTTAGATAGSATAWTDAGLSGVTNDVANAKVFNPFGFDVSSVTVDIHDTTGATVYATIMGFGSALAASPHVYRSTDFGAHWLNISANLPDAPANALVVDPNDANTVYVALDDGVYVTTQVTACASANCWSLLGTGLPNAPVTALAAAANVSTGDGRTGMLRAGTYGRGLWQTPLLTAISVAAPAMTLAPTAFTFAPQAVSTIGPAQTLTVTSTGNAPLTISSVVVSGDFVESDTCAGHTIAVGATCTVQLKFAPGAVGTRTGLVTVYANVAGGQATASLIGVGTAAAAIVLTPVSLTFGATVVNQTSAAQIVTVANTGGTVSALSTPVVTGDFAIKASTCGTTLAPQTACSLSIAFTPTASGARSGALTVIDDAGTQMAALTGTGNGPPTDALSASALTFATTQIGSTSAPQTITLTNAGDVALTLVNAQITSGAFTATSSCGTSLAAHATCAITVAFVPTVVGAATGVLTVTDAVRLQTVMLQGIGVAPAGVSLTPVAGLVFGATGVGLTSPAQTLTLTNNGGVTLTLTSITAGGDFHVATTTCAATVLPNAACTLLIVFTPTTGGPRGSTLTLTDNAPTGTQTVALTGAGVDFTLASSGPTSLTVTSGDSAVFPMLLSSAAGVTGAAALTCSGAPAHSACTVSPTSATLGGTTVVTVTVQTGLATAQLARPLYGRGSWIELALLVPLSAAAWRRRKLGGLTLGLFTMTMAFTLTLAGCGAGRQIPAAGIGGGTVTPTPSGTYPITVSAVSAGITRSVSVMVVVK